jgi:transcriptional regulator with XRE-family HTH domain
MFTNLEHYRKLRGLTVNELARRTGVDTTTIWRIENGLTDKPHRSTLYVLAVALGVSVDDLSGDYRRAA